MINWINSSLEKLTSSDPIGNAFGEVAARFEDQAVQFIIDQLQSITEILLDLLLSTPLYIMQTEGFRELYWLSMKLALVFITPVIMWFGLKMITGNISVDSMWESIKRYFYFPLFFVFCPYVIKKMLIIVNQVCHTLLANGNIEGILYPENFNLTLVVLVIVYVTYMVKIITFYAARNVKLVFLVIVSPMLYILWSLPGRFEKYNKWINEITTLILTQVGHIILLLILLKITKANAAASNWKDLITQLGVLIVMTEMKSWLEEYISTEKINLPDLNLKKYARKIRQPRKSLIKDLKFWK